MGRAGNDGRRRNKLALIRILIRNIAEEFFVAALHSRLFFALTLLVIAPGCGKNDGMATVSGKVTIDGGKIPPVGSSITFLPKEGRSAGATLENGNYSVRVPLGASRVEIRAPKTVPNPNASGSGPGAGDRVTESIQEKFNDQSELKIDVVAGSNKKDWEVLSKP